MAQINIGPTGPTPTPPATLRAQLLASVAAARPGITLTLPGSLMEDISSTSVGALAIVDQVGVDLVSSVGPFTANPFVLNQLGQVYGVQPGAATSTSVLVVFSGTPGFVVGKGFIVSDGSFQYTLADGGIVGSDGDSPPLFAVGTQTGTWAVPAGTVTQIVTSVPSGFDLAVVNPQPGIPGTDAETEATYRARVLQAGKAAAQGYYAMLATRLEDVEGVQKRLVNAIPQPGGGWEIIVGGGDPYLVAYAIYMSTQDISTLVGSSINVTGITLANPGVVSTDITHGHSVGQPVTLTDVNPSSFNGDYTVQAVPNANSFTLGNAYASQNIDTISWSGGVVTVTFLSAHGVTVGTTVTLVGNTPSGYNGNFTVASVPDILSFTYVHADPGASTVTGQLLAGVALFSTSLLAAWVSGGVVTPNFRNVGVTIVDFPNSYVIPFAVPPLQTVTMTVTWNTNSPNFVSQAAVAQLAAPAIAGYINSIQQGQAINELVMDQTFKDAVSSLLPETFISRLVYAVSIDGVGVSPTAGTRLVPGDPQSFLFAQAPGISVVQG